MISNKIVLIFYAFIILSFGSCLSNKTITTPPRSSHLTGREFYATAASFNWKQRDSLAEAEILHGNFPSFLKKFLPVHVQILDSASRKIIHATFFVSSDYLSAGTNNNWARINISPMAAQKIADSFHCFLPTKKMVDDIYRSAVIKLEPMPMYAFRDSSPTMYQHHLIIEGQRNGRKGLIAGIKKDLVISEKLLPDSKQFHVAIYGWHQLNGIPIQTLYTGHISSWVDYSQGTRLIYRNIKIDNKWMDYIDVLKHPVLHKLLCDEAACNFYRYNY
ncbi:MAG: hypothetical protein ABIW38_05135 [Ferruginibacter sp.]